MTPAHSISAVEWVRSCFFTVPQQCFFISVDREIYTFLQAPRALRNEDHTQLQRGELEIRIKREDVALLQTELNQLGFMLEGFRTPTQCLSTFEEQPDLRAGG